MMRRAIDVLVAAAIGSGLAVVCSSCSIWSKAEPVSTSKSVSQPSTRWEQVAYGRDARFAVCVEPTCPRVTPKTLPEAPAPIAAVTASKVALTPIRPLALQVTSPQPSATESRTLVITFAFGSAELTPRAKAVIRDSIDAARRADRIVISGRTDAVGSGKLNDSLAFTRALAVRNYFRDVVPDLPATFSIDAKGGCCFVASNDDGTGRSKNRRVEVQFSSRGGA